MGYYREYLELIENNNLRVGIQRVHRSGLAV